MGNIHRCDNRKDDDFNRVETSNDKIPQLNLENQDMTWIPWRFCGQITYDAQKQTYVFCW